MPDTLARMLILGTYAASSYADAMIGTVLDESGEPTARMLYEHENDPAETVNLAGDPTFAGVVGAPER